MALMRQVVVFSALSIKIRLSRLDCSGLSETTCDAEELEGRREDEEFDEARVLKVGRGCIIDNVKH